MLQGEGAAGNRRPRDSSALIAVAIAVIALAVTAAPAYGASTRAEYIAQVDPICASALKPESKAATAFFKELRGFKVQTHGRQPSKRLLNRFFRQSARFLGRIAGIEGRVNFQIAVIPPAPGDEAVISQWLEKRGEVVELLRQGVRALKHHRFRALERLSNRSVAVQRQADALIAGFGFSSCSSPI